MNCCWIHSIWIVGFLFLFGFQGRTPQFRRFANVIILTCISQRNHSDVQFFFQGCAKMRKQYLVWSFFTSCQVSRIKRRNTSIVIQSLNTTQLRKCTTYNNCKYLAPLNSSMCKLQVSTTVQVPLTFYTVHHQSLHHGVMYAHIQH